MKNIRAGWQDRLFKQPSFDVFLTINTHKKSVIQKAAIFSVEFCKNALIGHNFSQETTRSILRFVCCEPIRYFFLIRSAIANGVVTSDMYASRITAPGSRYSTGTGIQLQKSLRIEMPSCSIVKK